jgi:DNA-binding Xre family transcriptional regulator
MINLKEIRESKGFSRRELALLSGVNEHTIQHIENGITDNQEIKLSTLIKFCKALKCKLSDLLPKDLHKYIR